MRKLLALALLAGLAACGSDPVSPVDYFGGPYPLRTVNSLAVPVAVSIPSDDGSVTITQITSGSLTVDPALLVVGLAVRARFGTDPEQSTVTGFSPGYQRAGNAITVSFPAPVGNRPGTLAVIDGKRRVTIDIGSGFGVLVFQES